MSFSSLPTELVRQIITSTVPSTYQIVTWHDRQHTLAQLALVSRLFGKITQPLLFEIIFTFWSEKLHRMLDMLEGKGAADFIRQVVIRSGYLPFKVGDLERLARSSPGIHSLVLDVPIGGTLDLSVLQSFPNLTTLQLSGTFFILSSHIVLPKLKQLTLDKMALGELASMLKASTSVPSLKHLAILGENYRDYVSNFSESRLVDLVPQLDSLVFPCRFLRDIPVDLVPVFERTLFDYYPGVPNSFTSKMVQVRHLRLLGLQDSTKAKRRHPELPNQGAHIQLRDPEEARDLSKLVSAIQEQDPVQLETLYLDSSLKLTSPLDQEAEGRVEQLIRVCRDKGIEVIFEEQAKSCIDSIMSEEFIRRQKETIGNGSSCKARPTTGDLE